MMWFTAIRLVTLLVMLGVAACQPSAQVLPTVMDLSGTVTSDAATASVEAASIKTSQPPTLPPTWTPSPEAIVAPTDVPTPTSDAQATGRGHIFYIFNGDSVVRLAVDNGAEELILVGGAPADLTLSPDGTLLAYTAQGSGSAREVFVSNLDGTYTQRVSCLGFARVLDPTWSPDGTRLIFAASQTPTGSLGIYIADFAGSGDCPIGNNQHQLGQLAQTSVSDFTWNGDSSWVFFSSDLIYGIDMLNEELFPPLTHPSGYGPDYSSAHSPRTPQLMYLKIEFDEATGVTGGMMYQINSAQITEPPLQELRGAAFMARSLRWNADGRFLVIASERDVWVQDQERNTSLQIITGANFYPQPVFSPDAEQVAYVDGGSEAITVQQVFVISQDGQNPTQLTFHSEGTISDLNWSAN